MRALRWFLPLPLVLTTGCAGCSDQEALPCSPSDGCRPGRVCQDGWCVSELSDSGSDASSSPDDADFGRSQCLSGARTWPEESIGFEIVLRTTPDERGELDYAEGWFGHGFHPHEGAAANDTTLAGDWKIRDGTLLFGDLLACVDPENVPGSLDHWLWVCKLSEPIGDTRSVGVNVGMTWCR